MITVFSSRDVILSKEHVFTRFPFLLFNELFVLAIYLSFLHNVKFISVRSAYMLLVLVVKYFLGAVQHYNTSGIPRVKKDIASAKPDEN